MNIPHAIECLADSDRGRRVLTILASLQREFECLDSVNTTAVEDLVHVMAGHQWNGTMRDALAPYYVKPGRCFSITGHLDGETEDFSMSFNDCTMDQALTRFDDEIRISASEQGFPDDTEVYITCILRSDTPVIELALP